MKQQTVAQTGVGSSSAVVVNTNVTPVNLGFGVVVAGTVTYSVQHTYDDPAVGFSVWFNHPTAASLSVNADGSYTAPVTGVKVLVTAGTGSASLKLIQAGI